MSTYAIGDVQGCYPSLCRLLDTIRFDPGQDSLWFAGDLVNRGPDSLSVLRFVKSLGSAQQTVLGNHDFYLLIVAYDAIDETLIPPHDFHDVLAAPDRDELIDWLRQRPLLVADERLNTIMTHAGLPPQWTIAQAKQYAKEIEHILNRPPTVAENDPCRLLLTTVYGDKPDSWDDTLQGPDRWRFIINALTRMRFCDIFGRLDLRHKGKQVPKSSLLMPWFKHPHRFSGQEKLIFGHWSALEGVTDTPRIFAIDTGCCWGKKLTALRLEDQKRFGVDAVEHAADILPTTFYR